MTGIGHRLQLTITRQVRQLMCVAAGLMVLASADIAVAQVSKTLKPTNIAATSQNGSPASQIKLRADKHAGEVLIPINKSQILELDRAFTEVTLGNPEIADVVPLTTRSVYVFGKALGSTSLTLSGTGGRVIAVVDLVVSYDLEVLKGQIFDLVPGQSIEVRPSGEGLVLSGEVASAAQLQRVLSIAASHAGEKITNLMQVTGSQQVMVQMHFAEVDREVMKQFGVSNRFTLNGSDAGFDIITGDGPSVDPLSFGSTVVSVFSGDFTGSFLFDALEERGAIKTLAEPNLIALSGDTARFLAGGEFPIPVGRDEDGDGITITIEFKEFGVALSFTPTVLADSLINLELFTEVSEIDPASSIVFDDLLIPGLKVRRANTTVEVGNGQSFAIAGLIQEEFEDGVRQLPAFGDIPILGALFRSASYQSGTTELVVIITPYLVAPTAPGKLATAADSFIAPTEEELFALGRTEGERPEGEGAEERLGRAAAGGIVGPHGYILK